MNCGKTINVGRTDKRYCDDICRARDTRKRNRENQIVGYEDAHKAVINAIKKNHSLLKKAIGEREEWIVDFAELYFKGFDRKFYTSSEKTETGTPRYYCFELGWEDLSEARLLVTINPAKLKVFNANDLGYPNGGIANEID